MTLTWLFEKGTIPLSSIDQFLMKLFISHWSCSRSWNWYISQWIWYNVAFISSVANRTLLLSGTTQLQLTISFIGFDLSFDTLLSPHRFCLGIYLHSTVLGARKHSLWFKIKFREDKIELCADFKLVGVFHCKEFIYFIAQVKYNVFLFHFAAVGDWILKTLILRDS